MAFKNCDNFFYTEKDKPVVECRLQSNIVLNQKVAIVPYNHPFPEFNGCQCLTGLVTSISGDPQTFKQEFETEKVKYVVVG